VAQILIRQLDERVVAILRAQAQRRGVSLEQSLRDLLTAAAAERQDQRRAEASSDSLSTSAPVR
jgi:plasmid stability protein